MPASTSKVSMSDTNEPRGGKERPGRRDVSSDLDKPGHAKSKSASKSKLAKNISKVQFWSAYLQDKITMYIVKLAKMLQIDYESPIS